MHLLLLGDVQETGLLDILSKAALGKGRESHSQQTLPDL